MGTILVNHTVTDNNTKEEVPIVTNPFCFQAAENFTRMRDGV